MVRTNRLAWRCSATLPGSLGSSAGVALSSGRVNTTLARLLRPRNRTNKRQETLSSCASAAETTGGWTAAPHPIHPLANPLTTHRDRPFLLWPRQNASTLR